LFLVQPTSNSAAFSSWNIARPTSMGGIPSQFIQQMDLTMADIMLGQD
jgi:hypothetical protein